MSIPAYRAEPTTTPATSDLLTTKQVAAVYGLSQSTLRKWRCVGEGPRFARIGRAVRYRQSELEAFLDARTYASTAQADARLAAECTSDEGASARPQIDPRWSK